MRYLSPPAGALEKARQRVETDDVLRNDGAGALSPRFVVKLATSSIELRSAQELRYRVFFEEGRAKADAEMRRLRRETCRFDSVADHLIVVDNGGRQAGGAPNVVGSYRLLRQEAAEANLGFCSAAEFDIDSLVRSRPERRFMELGRSCIAPEYRGKRPLELLWRGLWSYALHHHVDMMFGCASFAGVAEPAHVAAIRLLNGGSAADGKWRVDAAPGAKKRIMSPAIEAIDPFTIRRSIPPLIKAYWNVGARFSRDAVIDENFGTTDVFVVMPIEEIKSRYLAYFAPLRAPVGVAHPAPGRSGSPAIDHAVGSG